MHEWPDLYKKVHAAGKKIQLYAEGFATVDAVAAQIGTNKVIHQRFLVDKIEKEAEIKKELLRYGINY